MTWPTEGFLSNQSGSAQTRRKRHKINPLAAAVSEALEARVMLSSDNIISPQVQAAVIASEAASGLSMAPAAQTSATSAVRADVEATPTVGSAKAATTALTTTHELGLEGSYYNGGDLSSTPVTRIDNSVNFNWGRTAPVKKVAGGTFAVDWTGELVAPRTGTFTFYVKSVGGADLTIDGNTLIDNTGSSPAKIVTATATMSLVAGQSYPLNLEYTGTGKRAMISFQFSGPKTPRQVIPRRDYLSGLAAPTTPTGLSAQVASSSEIDLSWEPDADATAFAVQRSGDGVHFSTIATIGDVTGYQDLSVRGNTTYSYRIIASNAVGSSAASSPISVSTLPGGVTAIDASAEPMGPNTIAVTWQIPTATLTGFQIARKIGTSSTWTTLGSVGATTGEYTDATATDGQSYSYQITALDGSSTAPFVGTTSVVIPLAAPSGLGVSQTSGTTATLSWTNNSTSATGVEIESSTNGGVTWSVVTTLGATATSYNATISPGQNYAYRVCAVEGSSVSSAFSNTVAISPGLTAPSSLTATVNSPNSITLRWTDSGTGQTGCEIQRSSDGGNTWPTAFSASASATSYTDTTALGAATYTYRVFAYAGSTDSANSNAVIATTGLAAPGNVTASALTASAITLSWTETNAGETGYQIQRSPNGSSGWTTLTTTAAGTTSYTDSNLSYSTTYYYLITALGPNSTSAAAPVVNATTASSDTPQYLLTPSALATMQADAENNTPQWQAFEATLNSQLNQVTEPGWEGSNLPYIADYALGYQVLQTSDPTLADQYADKAIGILLSGTQGRIDAMGASTDMYLARGDGSTTTFTLPNTDINLASVVVWTPTVTVVPVTKGATNGQDPVSAYTVFLKASNTPDGPANYTEGVDWTQSPNAQMGYIDWSLGSSNQPATGSTYYVTMAAASEQSALGSGWTVSGNTLTFTTPPAANQAIFVQYQYTDAATGLMYQQTNNGLGGLVNVNHGSGYPARFLRYIAVGLDWLWDYQGLSTQVRSSTMAELTTWSNFLTNTQQWDSPNYVAGQYALLMATAITLQNRDLTDAPGLQSALESWRTTYVLPMFAAPANGQGSEAGGFWSEGWSYGDGAVQNILTSEMAFQDAGWGSASVTESWANDVIVALIEEQPTQSTIYDGGQDYDFPEPFVDKALIEDLAAAATNSTDQSYANYILQNYPGSTGDDWNDLLFRNPTAPASFWSSLPLQQYSEGQGLAVAREDWNYNSTWLAFTSGNLYSYPSFAQGGLELDRGADQLLVNAAAISEDQSLTDIGTYASTVVIDDGGAGQQTYRYAQGGWYGNPGNTMPHFDGTSNFAYFQGNYAAAYRAYSGSTDPASTLVRDVFFIRGSNYVIVYDRATTTQASFLKRLQWSFSVTPTVSGNSWVAAVGSSKLFGQTYSDVPLTTVETAVNDNGSTIQQIQTTNSSPTATVDYVTALQVASSAVASMDSSTHVESNDGQLEGVEIGPSGGPGYIVLFGKNGQVNGGTSYQFTAASGQTTTNYLSDMTPGATYTLTGANQGSATADSQGVLTFTTTGTGTAQTVTLST